MEEEKVLNNEENNAIEKSDKGKNVLITILILLILAIIGMGVYYRVLKPKDGEKTTDNGTTTSTTTVLSNDEALTIAKEKVEAANNFWGDFTSSSDCEDNIEERYCYYDTLDNFKNKFYSIYSNDLTYTDVFNDSQTFAPYIKTSDNKTYVFNHCTEGSSDKSLKGDYEIKSVTTDTIIAKYIILDTDSVTGNTFNQDVEIKLVKEDNSWKIMKATLIGRCNGIYEVGK